MWYKSLLKELNQIETYAEPNSGIEEGERVVGTMSDEAKKLYTLGQKLQKQAVEDLIHACFTGSEEGTNKAMLKAAELKEKSETVREIMWITIKDDIHLWGESIGIRKGFQVVVMTQRNAAPDFLKFLGNLN